MKIPIQSTYDTTFNLSSILDNLNDLSYEIIFKAHDIRDDQEYDIQRWSGIGYLEKVLTIV